jgi:hypothetical protein
MLPPFLDWIIFEAAQLVQLIWAPDIISDIISDKIPDINSLDKSGDQNIQAAAAADAAYALLWKVSGFLFVCKKPATYALPVCSHNTRTSNLFTRAILIRNSFPHHQRPFTPFWFPTNVLFFQPDDSSG